jgi:nucleoside 2-deoxyribosyltransferase
MPEPNECILCGMSANIRALGPLNKVYSFECKNCGQFSATSEFVYRINLDGIRHLLSGYIYEQNYKRNEIILRTDNYEDILRRPTIPKNPNEQIEKLLQYYKHMSKFIGSRIKTCTMPAIAYAYNVEELSTLYNIAVEKGLIKNDLKGHSVFLDASSPYDYSILTLSGHEFCQHVDEEKWTKSNSVFVAMWFSQEILFTYQNAIKPAIESEVCGNLKAFCLIEHEHNNDITDEIIAGIKESLFVVADMTGYRGGVYYEAGFAKGLGRPVIFTCRKDWFEGEKDSNGRTIKEKVHFDVNHQNFIVWENEEVLKEKLIARIRASIL